MMGNYSSSLKQNIPEWADSNISFPFLPPHRYWENQCHICSRMQTKHRSSLSIRGLFWWEWRLSRCQQTRFYPEILFDLHELGTKLLRSLCPSCRTGHSINKLSVMNIVDKWLHSNCNTKIIQRRKLLVLVVPDDLPLQGLVAADNSSEGRWILQ